MRHFARWLGEATVRPAAQAPSPQMLLELLVLLVLPPPMLLLLPPPPPLLLLRLAERRKLPVPVTLQLQEP